MAPCSSSSSIPRAPRPARPDLLRLTFGLTRAEAALALRLLAGHGLPSAAAELGVSHSTARTHLRAIFRKTGTNRQAELARLLARLAG